MEEDSSLYQLVTALMAVRNRDEALAFLRDLMTEAELREFSKRWKAARLLHEKVPYTSIESETGLSSATIARVSKWLQEGAGGYRMILNRLDTAVEVAHDASESATATLDTVIARNSAQHAFDEPDCS